MRAAVFLGGGRITSALIAGLRLAGYDQPLLVHDRNPHKLRELKRRYRVETELNLTTAVAQARVLIVAVRPDSVRGLFSELRAAPMPAIAVSLAAGIPLAVLKQMAPAIQWVRAMPSPVCRSGRGLTALTFDARFPKQGKRLVKRLFGCTGAVLEIPERGFDAFTVTYSSSHGYHALRALAQAAQQLGLDRKTAMTAAAHALADGIQYWRESRSSLPRLLHEAATPGGIAGTVMATMESAGYENIVKRGLQAGLTRARKNAKP
ncbi:MAG TPA: pyrroline-5-carboxylate reductase dimerization domain-containing protein [Terriglobales bacterium]|nr:pyrroline-5-carboxylate reductase dimerization domain-containing protein [Terriglobales bacterium]